MISTRSNGDVIRAQRTTVGHSPTEVSELVARFPGIPIWRGEHTGSWWALVPIDDGRLVEALNPAELAQAIIHPKSWPWP